MIFFAILKESFMKFRWVILIFLFAVVLRLWNLNQMGRTWDEMVQLVKGHQFIELIKKGDFANSFWYQNPDHPPLKDYTYGLAGYLDQGQYDLTYSRLVSVLFSSLSVALVVLIGWEFISPFVGIAGGVILAMLPFFLGLSQLVTIESPLMFFFTAAIYSFFKFLRKFSLQKAIVTGVLLGLALETKFTNVLLIPLLIVLYALWYIFFEKKKKKKILYKYFLLIFFVAFVVFFLLWPMPWFHLSDILGFNYHMRFENTKYSIPEVFFGKVRLVPIFYYSLYFFITTPLLILLLFFVGIRSIFKKKTFILCALLLWFSFPFMQSFYNFRQHGVRYIIEIYAPLALLAAVGFESLIDRFTKKLKIKLLCFFPIVIYLFVIIFRITPYYLDYFNIFVGGARGVYERNLFQLGWWGQGIKEASLYLDKHAKQHATVGLAVIPLDVVPPTPHLKTELYKKGKRYDYVIVSHFNVTREGFDDSEIKKNYKPIYFVNADGAHLVTVYKRNK